VEIKPLARVYLTRQRLYEKSCSDENLGGANDYESGFDDPTASGGMVFAVNDTFYYKCIRVLE